MVPIKKKKQPEKTLENQEIEAYMLMIEHIKKIANEEIIIHREIRNLYKQYRYYLELSQLYSEKLAGAYSRRGELRNENKYVDCPSIEDINEIEINIARHISFFDKLKKE